MKSFIKGLVIGAVFTLTGMYIEQLCHQCPLPSIQEVQRQCNESIDSMADFDYTKDDELLDAIEWVESKGDAFAIGDNGEAVGAYQLHKIYVDDHNRISILYNRTMEDAGREGYHKYYNYDDRFDKKKSRLMVDLYTWEYGCNAVRKHGIGLDEARARVHNGGPNGCEKESTLLYWEKVKARMENIRRR
jgi:hypothetical protein